MLIIQHMKHIPFSNRFFSILLFLSLFSTTAFAQNVEINLDDLISETQFMSDDPDLMRMVWYIPVEYWEATFSNDPSISDDEVKEIIDILDDYELFFVIDGVIGTFGNVRYQPRSEIKRNLRLHAPSGEYYPLDDNEINGDAKSMMTIMSPILASMMGTMGENMQFFFFKGKNKNKRLINPTGNESFKVQVASEMFEFNLPLASLLPPKFCPEDNAKMKGTWIYCPFHGTTLVDQAN